MIFSITYMYDQATNSSRVVLICFSYWSSTTRPNNKRNNKAPISLATSPQQAVQQGSNKRIQALDKAVFNKRFNKHPTSLATRLAIRKQIIAIKQEPRISPYIL